MGGGETIKGDQTRFYKTDPTSGNIPPPGFQPVINRYMRKIEVSEVSARPLSATGKKFSEVTLRELPGYIASIRVRYLSENLVDWYASTFSRRSSSIYHFIGLGLFVGMVLRMKTGTPEYASDWGLGHNLRGHHDGHHDDHHEEGGEHH